MTTTTKSVTALVLALVIGVAIYGAYQYPQSKVAVSSPAGSTFSTAKIAAVTMAPQSITSTSTSILNTDSSDRYVLDGGVMCPSGLTNMNGSTGAGVDAFHWYAATSSTAAPTGSVANAALAALNVTVATSSAAGYTATSTFTNIYARTWNAGTYMVFQTNATSTSAICQPFLHYISS